MIIFKILGVLIILVLYGYFCFFIGRKQGFNSGLRCAMEIIEDVKQDKYGK